MDTIALNVRMILTSNQEHVTLAEPAIRTLSEVEDA